MSRKRRIFQEVKVEPVKKEVDKELKRAVEKESSLMKVFTGAVRLNFFNFDHYQMSPQF